VGVLRQALDDKCVILCEDALFSFEGMNLDRSSRLRLSTIVAVPSPFASATTRFASSAISRPSDAAIGREILENCIEKNFHVSTYESGQRIFNLNALVQFCVVENK
jgi:hypothetical protein